MSGSPKQRVSRLFALGGALCVPLAGLAWSTSASTATLPVSVSVVSSVNPSLFGQDVTYPATLITSDSGSLDLGDGMESKTTGTTSSTATPKLLVGTGPGTYTATCDEPANSLSVGDHAITAIFNGDSTYFPDAGSLPTQTVTQADTTTTITSPYPELRSPTETSHNSLSM